MGLFVNIYPHEFILCIVRMRIRCFRLYLSYGIQVNLAAYYTHAKARVMFGCSLYLLCMVLSCMTAFCPYLLYVQL